jgi:beta-galactosidase
LVSEVKTTGTPSKISLEADRKLIAADGSDLSYITVKILDNYDTMVPDADNLVHFEIAGEGKIAGVDNGSETSMESFKANFRNAFNGMCLVVIQSTDKSGSITLKATSYGLKESEITINTK